MSQVPSPLSRTSSFASTSSDDNGQNGNATPDAVAAKRTRKRFSQVQLMLLEQLFHQTSHPTREQRENVAKEAGMEIRSVTIWFQNKRQTERKSALQIATNQPLQSRPSDTTKTNTTPITTTKAPTAKRTLSLDDIASRSELRVHTPRTPSRTPSRLSITSTTSTDTKDPATSKDNSASRHIWDNMPSSPLIPPTSPPGGGREFDYVEFGLSLTHRKGTTGKALRRTRTLEWACAAARVAVKQSGNLVDEVLHEEKIVGGRGGAGKRKGLGLPRESEMDVEMEIDGGEETEEEVFEAVTPGSSVDSRDSRWTRSSGRSSRSSFGGEMGKDLVAAAPHDDDTMRAALALCGLGRR
ncbi:hypothetical protein JAAARDRAFT_44019 [Jaapia argillacea MUCL 33604]|uniref:Homeobox domain-containing protein n=1 Tax=Jaapia argillacea MUCL 33604 TaxID=933084 RepID=A0A067Q7M0_9AGAM|nr:hypothetical protein JAAARDRAFT_44019 [Jaapia argillacea MUCL 33604]